MTKLLRRRSAYVRTGEQMPLQLTERDKEIFKLVKDLGVATSEQIHRCLFHPGSLKVCQRRLQKLWLNDYMDRVFTPIMIVNGQRTLGIPRPFYRIAEKGAKEIEQNVAVDMLHSASPSYILLEHNHQVNEFRTSLELALKKRFGRKSQMTWISETILRERNRKARQERGSFHCRSKLVLADGLVSFVTPSGQTEFFFLEIDRGTESLWRLVQRAKAYIHLHKTGLKRSIHGVPSFRVLIVTKSMDRLMNLRAQIAGLGECLNMFWFSTFEEKAGTDETPVLNLKPERILEPIWHKITDSQLYSLLGTPSSSQEPSNTNK